MDDHDDHADDVPEDEQCEHNDCEDRGYDDWELADGRWCCDHVPASRRAPQEWYR